MAYSKLRGSPVKEVTELKLLFSLILSVACAAAPACAAPDPLAAQVTSYRDNYGVPHIVGETEQATFFGYGYAQAEDHLEEMMIQYRDAQGRRAEVQGMEALGDGYLHFIPYEYRWDGDYLQRLLRTKAAVVENRAGSTRILCDPRRVCAGRRRLYHRRTAAKLRLDRSVTAIIRPAAQRLHAVL